MFYNTIFSVSLFVPFYILKVCYSVHVSLSYHDFTICFVQLAIQAIVHTYPGEMTLHWKEHRVSSLNISFVTCCRTCVEDFRLLTLYCLNICLILIRLTESLFVKTSFRNFSLWFQYKRVFFEPSTDEKSIATYIYC